LRKKQTREHFYHFPNSCIGILILFSLPSNMSKAVSTFMEALKQASQSNPPGRPSEPKTVQQGLENHDISHQRTQMPVSQNAAHSLKSSGPLHHSSAMMKPTTNQDGSQRTLETPCRNFIDPYHQRSGIEISSNHSNSRSGPSAGEPTTRPQLPVRDSLDDLFSEAESNQDDTVNYILDTEDAHDNGDVKEPSWASGGELVQKEVDVRDYDPNAPTAFHQEMNINAQDFGSPQVSPETPFYPHPQPSLKISQSNATCHEGESALSEEDQIAYFSDKAFRKALREVEPSLSKEQQYYAWRNAYQDAYDEQPESTIDLADDEERSATPDQNPPYQLGMEPVGFMDGVPIFADMNATSAREEIDDRAEQTHSRKYGSVEAEEGSERERHERSDSHADVEETRPFNPFYTHHNMPGPTAPRADVAKREQMLESSFSKALQALERDNAERIARESEVDEAHLRRLRTLSQRREWVVDDGDSDDRHRNLSTAAAVRGQDSPEAQAPWCTTEERSASPLMPNHDESFATAFESPEKQSSISTSMREVLAEMEEDRKQLCAEHHDQAILEDESTSHSKQIPGLDHLNPPSSLFREETSVPYQPFTPPSPKSHWFEPDIRKSIEPDTPRHLLNRECTPAFEDRSPTPSPRSLSDNHGETDFDMDLDTDTDMNEASPLPPASHQHHRSSSFPNSPKPASPLPTTSPDPFSRPHDPHQQRDQHQQTPTNKNPPSRSPSRSRSPTKTSPSKPDPPLRPPPSLPTSTTNPTKPRPSTSGRRKSAVLGTNIKIGKKQPTPKSRNVTRKVTSSIKKAVEGGKKKGSKVKEAVQKIEASVQEEKGVKKATTTTTTTTTPPPTRRSRRLMEGRGETPEPG